MTPARVGGWNAAWTGRDVSSAGRGEPVALAGDQRLAQAGEWCGAGAGTSGWATVLPNKCSQALVLKCDAQTANTYHRFGLQARRVKYGMDATDERMMSHMRIIC